MNRFGSRGGGRWFDPARSARWGALMVVGLTFAACSGGNARPPPAGRDSGATSDLGAIGTCPPDVSLPRGDCVSGAVDQPPEPRLRFQLHLPSSADDYPYSPASLPAEGPAPRSTVYLSAKGSADPEGGAVSIFWNVQDPSGAYLPIVPEPSAANASFFPSVTGPHVVTLLVTETSGLRQTGQVPVTLDVRPIPCAEDGVSAPCSDGLPVPGGTFVAGSADGVGFDDEHPSHRATVADFILDKYEVTVGRFRKFLAAYEDSGPPADGAGAHPLIAGSGWRATWNTSLPATKDAFEFALSECGGAWTNDVGPSEARPVTCVTWFEAMAFCIAENQRLPTEAEWEYAAAGGDRQWIYPWGDDPPSVDRAVFGCLFDGRPMSCLDADLPVVGSVAGGAGRWGHLDLAGSVWEWTFDAYGAYSAADCDNCANVDAVDPTAPPSDTGSDNTARVFRGGDYKFDDPAALRAASRYTFDGSFPDQTRGFRCARSMVTAR
jgi:formylglycine-generating enzyme